MKAHTVLSPVHGCQVQPIRRKQSGVALAIVVWFIAGMSVLVAGIVSTASVDTRMTQLHVARAKTSAAGDGAIHLALANLVAGDVPTSALSNFEGVVQRVGELDVTVKMIPSAGLIDLNSAPYEVLAALFSLAGELDQAQSERLADNVVNWRRPATPSGRGQKNSKRFSEVEDLLRVEGISRTLVDGVRDYVVAGRTAAGRTNWSIAPDQVLAVLAQYNPGAYESILRKRAAAVEPDTSGKGALGAGAVRVDAMMRYDGRTWLRRRWLTMESDVGSMLPWRVVRTEAPRVVAG